MKQVINVVGAAFVDGGKVFAARRSYGSEYVIHKYEFVGGKAEDGEDEPSALARECREELDTEISVIDILGRSRYEYPDKIVDLTVYLCSMLSGYDAKEHEECVWLSINDTVSEDWAPADRNILDILKARYTKKYALITGATGYIGAAFCREFASRGENLFITGRSASGLSELKTELCVKFPDINVEWFACDLADEKSREALCRYGAGFVFSRIVNVAGADIQKAFEKYDEKKILFQTRILFEAAVSMTRFCLSRRAERFTVINISSMSGLNSMPYFAIYAALKGALTSFSLAVGEEYKGSGVTVTAVLPGAVYTRPDVKEYIKKQGVWGKIAAKTPEFVAKKSIKAAEKGKRKYIPGAANKAMRVFAALIPERIRLKFIAAKWSKTEKDAF